MRSYSFAANLDRAALHRLKKPIKLHIDAASLAQLGGDDRKSAGNPRIRGAAPPLGIAHPVRNRIVTGAKTDIDDTQLIFNQAFVANLAEIVEHQIEQGTEGLRDRTHFVDIDDFILALAGGIGYRHRMLALQNADDFLPVLPVETDRQAGHDIDRDVASHQAGGGGKSEGFGVTADELFLIEGKEPDTALPLGQFADEKTLAVDLDLQVVITRALRPEAFPETGCPRSPPEPT